VKREPTTEEREIEGFISPGPILSRRHGSWKDIPDARVVVVAATELPASKAPGQSYFCGIWLIAFSTDSRSLDACLLIGP
jgi:hypothetical protein